MTGSTRTRAPRRKRERSRQSLGSRARAGLAAAMGLALLAYLVVVAIGHAYPATHPEMGTGSIWLPSDATGGLTLFDGSTVMPAYQVELVKGAGLLAGADAGDTGYAVDQRTGMAWSVNGSTMKASPGGVLAGKNDVPEAFATQAAFYVVSNQPGGLKVVSTSPYSPIVGARTFKVPHATTASADIATDQDGRLWILNPDTGTLTWFTDGQQHGPVQVAPPGSHPALAITDDQPVIVTPKSQTAQLLDPATGALRRTLPVPGLAASAPVPVPMEYKAVTAAGITGTPQVVIATATGAAFVCSFATTSPCRAKSPLQLDGPADLGPPVEAGGDAYFPDYAHGGVIIVSPTLAPVGVTKKKIFSPQTRFDLLTKDGLVFYNNPKGNEAGVISADGSVRSGKKYNVSTPVAKAPPAPGGSATASPSPSATPVTSPVTSPTPSPAISLPSPTTAASGPAGPAASSGAGTQPAPPSPCPQKITGLPFTPVQPEAGDQVTISVSYCGPAPPSWTWTINGKQIAKTPDSAIQVPFPTAGSYAVAVSAGSASKSTTVTVIPRATPNAQCGVPITRSLTLNTDLSCSGDGLIIAADDITVDMAGHTISGPGSTGTGIHLQTTEGSATQVVNFTLKDGKVTGFDQTVNDDGVNPASITMSEMTISGGTLCGDAAESCDFEGGQVSNSVVHCGTKGKLTINGATFTASPVTNALSCSIGATHSTFSGASVAINDVFDSVILDCTFSGDKIGVETELGVNGNQGLFINGSTFDHDSEAGIDVTMPSIGGLPLSGIENNTFNQDGSAAGTDRSGNPLQGGLHVNVLGNLPPVGGKLTIAGNHGTDDGGFDIWVTPNIVIDSAGNTSDRGADGCHNIVCANP